MHQHRAPQWAELEHRVSVRLRQRPIVGNKIHLACFRLGDMRSQQIYVLVENAVHNIGTKICWTRFWRNDNHDILLALGMNHHPNLPLAMALVAKTENHLDVGVGWVKWVCGVAAGAARKHTKHS